MVNCSVFYCKKISETSNLEKDNITFHQSPTPSPSILNPVQPISMAEEMKKIKQNKKIEKNAPKVRFTEQRTKRLAQQEKKEVGRFMLPDAPPPKINAEVVKFTPSTEVIRSDEDISNYQIVDSKVGLVGFSDPASQVPDALPLPASSKPELNSDKKEKQNEAVKKRATPSSGSPRKKARHSLGSSNKRTLVDSGSEVESDEDDEGEKYNIRMLGEGDGCKDRVIGNGVDEELETPAVAQEHGACEDAAIGEDSDGLVESLEQPPVGQECEGLDVFSWSKDFSSFSGQEETYLRSPGPMVGPQDPAQLFMEVWDERIMTEIVRETNRYAWQIISSMTMSEHGLPKNLNWTDTTVSEMYRYFALLILMSLCHRAKMVDYWTTGILEMPKLRKVMSKHRFFAITRFLHFVDNERNDPSLSSYEKKKLKISSIIKHCNKKFREIYTPSKHLRLDESLLLWKGRLSWAQCIRTKAARFGIKSFELCEATSGYQLKCLLYAGKSSSMLTESTHGFTNCTAKVVLELMDGYLDVGHTLVVDNWYNRLSLTRFLKRRHTDVIGTMNRRLMNVPDDIKNLNEKRMLRGQQVARHCGDISLIAWKDVKLVTVMSTYHNDLQSPSPTKQVDKKSILKPNTILEYNKYMGGADSKDQKLSMYLLERKRGQKWYMKVFKRLLNTSLLNTFIIYTKNPMPRPLTHREFRVEVALGLLEHFSSKETPVNPLTPASPDLDKNVRRLQVADHFPAHTGKMPGKNKHKQLRCVRCTAAGRRTMVTVKCTFCNVPLCFGSCWAEYHQLKKL
ncbi:piggyBac transposable element-derived protein 4-like isoform X1 [Ostrinia furnacalis]|uniref:piggyBac transposable element-derived protein 4-like isoform X1 n=2 Tax=Ostrinia furnacalis TaxID=93504 RepID=UPI0010399E90|nr:piggyBac transposable element-derived protein 4-like isoform X1 [Ostrinia furnacalis]